LALILSDVEATQLHYHSCAASVITAASDCKPASARAILCNAGQANSNGAQGWSMFCHVVGQCSRFLQNLSHSSTGVIGKRIPMDILQFSWLQLSLQTGSDAAAQAIITTDLVTKSIAFSKLG